MSRRRVGLGLALPLLVLSCDETAPPRDQWRIFIGTDATVPQMGDRLLVEIVDEDGAVCSSCRRQFGAADPAVWPISMGVAPREDGARLGVRARLYRTAITGDDGLPGTDRHIDAFAWLPEGPGIAEVALELRMSCFGVPVVGFDSCDPKTGALAAAPELEVRDGAGASLPKTASWELAGPTGCEGVEVGPDEICIPGGAFLLGNPRYLPLDEELVTVPEQLVVLSPFAIDAHEMSVGALRPFVDAGTVSQPFGVTSSPYCTWDRGDDLPVNCYDWNAAKSACEAMGKRLPTEAEWEYVASNLQRETEYPWLDSAADPCTQAIIDQENGRCRPSGDPVGPLVGSALDVTLLGVHDMGGNVAEWVLDVPSPYASSDCWGELLVLRSDPVCRVVRDDDYHLIRGGSWTVDPFQLRGSNRNAAKEKAYSVGFRCARTL